MKLIKENILELVLFSLSWLKFAWQTINPTKGSVNDSNVTYRTSSEKDAAQRKQINIFCDMTTTLWIPTAVFKTLRKCFDVNWIILTWLDRVSKVQHVAERKTKIYFSWFDGVQRKKNRWRIKNKYIWDTSKAV